MKILGWMTRCLLLTASTVILLGMIVFAVVVLNIHAFDDYAFRFEAFENDVTVVKLLLYFGANVHARSDQSLQIAAQEGDTEIVKILLDHKANVHANDDAPLYLASLKGHENIVKLLLARGADVHAKEDSALQAAVLNNHPEIVKLLLDNGSDVSGCAGRTLIDYADHRGFTSVGRLLRERRSPADENHALVCGANKLLETNP